MKLAETEIPQNLVDAFVSNGASQGTMSHEAPTNDGFCVNIFDLKKMFPSDVLEHPDWYGAINKEGVDQLRDVFSSNVDSVRIYRAVPTTDSNGSMIDTIFVGDWISLSYNYAYGEAMYYKERGEGWHILTAVVPASNVWTNGDSLEEWGFDSTV